MPASAGRVAWTTIGIRIETCVGLQQPESRLYALTMSSILILGAYGLIGSSVTAHLLARGHRIIGLGRTPPRATLHGPKLNWHTADIGLLTQPDDWTPFLDGCDVIVNCAGALQDGARDDVAAVQQRAMIALFEAARQARIRRFVQISAPGASTSSSTAFSRTKAIADDALSASGLDWTILRPGLVIAPHSYGGSALLRALAVLPGIAPVIPLETRVQTVHVADVANAVARAVEEGLGSRQILDLVEDDTHALDEVVATFRTWLGKPPGRRIVLPMPLVRAMFRCGDLAVRLGWRTPVCSTALAELEAGVVGDPQPWRAVSGSGLTSVRETLKRIPATLQERRAAVMWMLKPALILAMALFWVASGIIGFVSVDQAATILTSRGMPANAATALVLGGSVIDILLGAALLVRSWAGRAIAGMLVVSVAYLVLGTALAPGLWLDPLGPLLKIVPVMLAIVTLWSVLEDR